LIGRSLTEGGGGGGGASGGAGGDGGSGGLVISGSFAALNIGHAELAL
jgi:hypothetical protein